MRDRKIVLLCVAVLTLAACGGGDKPDGEPEAAPSPSPSTAPGFLDYEYKMVDPKTCDNSIRLGDKKAVTLAAPDTVGTTIFKPGCVMGVKSESVELTLKNTSTNLHNIIVEGNADELVAAAGETRSAGFKLAPNDNQIGFQCTIHDRMYGAFFR